MEARIDLIWGDDNSLGQESITAFIHQLDGLERRGVLLTRRLQVMMVVAALIGAAYGVIGLYLSYYISVASGAAIVLVCTAFFLLALFFAPTRGIVWRFARNR